MDTYCIKTALWDKTFEQEVSHNHKRIIITNFSRLVQYLTYLLLLEDNIQTTLSSYLLIFCAFVVIHHFCWFAS